MGLGISVVITKFIYSPPFPHLQISEMIARDQKIHPLEPTLKYDCMAYCINTDLPEPGTPVNVNIKIPFMIRKKNRQKWACPYAPKHHHLITKPFHSPMMGDILIALSVVLVLMRSNVFRSSAPQKKVSSVTTHKTR